MSDKFNILIVDNDKKVAKTLKDILNIKGYEADVAYGDAEALAKVTETHFDCILSDIKMPKSNGVELHRAVQKTHPDLPVVLMTATLMIS
jgi:CheY-like chemotaxis protein